MADIWFTSDTHFTHQGSLEWEGELDSGEKHARPFDDVYQMNELMIERWNELVKPQDKVYHLGDVFFGAKDTWNQVHARLNGKKRLLFGNHDDARYLSGKNPLTDQWYFQKVGLWRSMSEFGLLLTHVPVSRQTLGEGRFDRGMINVHGHIHLNPGPPGPYFCVCVERNGYYPFHLDELRAVRGRLLS